MASQIPDRCSSEKAVTGIMKLTVILAVLIAIASLACSNIDSTPAESNPNIHATVHGKEVQLPKHIEIPKYMDGVWLCIDESAPLVDDLSTEKPEDYRCSVTIQYTDEFAIVKSNGIPNHDYESGLGCCAREVGYEWRIPLKPELAESATYVPERGPIAVSVNGVPFFGPEEGPGGDAVALHFGYFEEDRQAIELGVCGGHSGPGNMFHYHYDANCIHWHAEEGETMYDYNLDSQRTLSTHSKIVGFALDGYAIYGYSGWNDEGEVVEMTSSYRLKDGADGSGGIDDYEYIKDLGTLDSCNGIFSETPDWPEGIYHYHTTMLNGEGGIGFPYFINCYAGELPSDNGNGDEEDPCAGGPPDGDVWGPGVGPPPEGCDAGPPPGGGQGQSSEALPVISPWFKTPPNSGAIVISLLAMAVVAANGLRESAYPEVSRDPVGTTL